MEMSLDTNKKQRDPPPLLIDTNSLTTLSKSKKTPIFVHLI